MPKTQKNISTKTESDAGRALYDIIMSVIEPDLTTSEIDTVDARYGAESVIDHAARMERYENAFKEFDRVFALMVDARIASAKEQKAKVRSKALGNEKRETNIIIEELEQKLQDDSNFAA